MQLKVKERLESPSASNTSTLLLVLPLDCVIAVAVAPVKLSVSSSIFRHGQRRPALSVASPKSTMGSFTQRVLRVISSAAGPFHLLVKWRSIEVVSTASLPNG